MFKRIREFPSNVKTMLKISGLRRRERAASKAMSTHIDIHTDKQGALRFHIHRTDDTIVATSNPYHDLAELQKDLDSLMLGSIHIAST